MDLLLNENEILYAKIWRLNKCGIDSFEALHNKFKEEINVTVNK